MVKPGFGGGFVLGFSLWFSPLFRTGIKSSSILCLVQVLSRVSLKLCPGYTEAGISPNVAKSVSLFWPPMHMQCLRSKSAPF